MSLVTRCTTCSTVFRVVQDQLKVSSGWVRCGRCGEVFNALQTLFDLERDAQVLAAPPGGAGGGFPPAPPGGFRPSSFAGLTDEPTPSELEPNRRVLRGALPSGPATRETGEGPVPSAPAPSPPMVSPPPPQAEASPAPGDVQAAAPALGGGPADPWQGLPSDGDGPREARPGWLERGGIEPRLDPEPDASLEPLAAGPDGQSLAPERRPDPAAVDDIDEARAARPDGASIWPTDSQTARWIEPPLDSATPTGGGAGSDSRQLVVVEGEPSEAPTFLREAERRGRAASPVVRGLTAFTALALAALLAGQWALHERDRVADLWPWSRPLLAQACRVAGCELLEAPRRLEAFTVESTTLTKAGNAGTYRLSITLRNRAPRPATLPSVELALTDTDGRLVSRRALHPADFRIQRPLVPGGADTTLQLLMTAPQDRVNGYTIEIFYP